MNLSRLFSTLKPQKHTPPRLVSDGGIHSHINHLKGLLDAANSFGLDSVFLHAFTDGRDCDPKSGRYFISDIQHYMRKTTGELATITGRYYAMDRDKRWERVKLAYDALVNGRGLDLPMLEQSIVDSYHNHVTDEFIKPVIMTDENGNPKLPFKRRRGYFLQFLGQTEDVN